MSTPSDDVSHDLPGWIADRLASARADAQRIARELIRDGRITADEVTTLAAAVDEAVERGRALIGDALREPRRILDGLRQSRGSSVDPDAPTTVASADVAAQIARLEARVAALEALLGAAPGGSRGADEGT